MYLGPGPLDFIHLHHFLTSVEPKPICKKKWAPPESNRKTPTNLVLSPHTERCLYRLPPDSKSKTERCKKSPLEVQPPSLVPMFNFFYSVFYNYSNNFFHRRTKIAVHMMPTTIPPIISIIDFPIGIGLANSHRIWCKCRQDPEIASAKIPIMNTNII